MNPGLHRIFPEYLIIRLHLDFLHTVQRHHIEIPDGFVVLRRIAGSHDDPALRNRMISKGLALEKLQHGRSQRLRHTVNLIDKKNPLV